MVEGGLDYRTFSAYREQSKGKQKFFVIFVLVLFLIVVIVLGGLFVVGSLNRESQVILPTPTIAAVMTPLPTSSISAVLTPNLTEAITPSTGLSVQDKSTNLDKSKLRIAVLNGSGEKGAARKVSAYLEGLGYQISNVGNAEAFTYRNITVIVKKSKSSYAPLLKRDLEANPAFVSLSGAGASVSASASDDISSEAEVIVGR